MKLLIPEDKGWVVLLLFLYKDDFNVKKPERLICYYTKKPNQTRDKYAIWKTKAAAAKNARSYDIYIYRERERVLMLVFPLQPFLDDLQFTFMILAP